MSIFVQIPAYRDRELPATLIDLYSKADAPDRLRTCVLWQRAEDESLDERVEQLPNVELIKVSYQLSQSANWARRILQKHWAGEPYTLLLDSHHRFTQGWDTQLLTAYGQCRACATKPLLTAYMPAYEPSSDPFGRRQKPYKTYPYQREAGVLSKLTSYPITSWEDLAAPVEADFVCLHFVFTTGELYSQLVFDPEIYYLRDEVVMSVQAFTRGYDLFHPHRIIGWHCYERASRVAHWQDHADWHDNQAAALSKMRRLFLGELPTELGRERSLADFEERIMTRLVRR